MKWLDDYITSPDKCEEKKCVVISKQRFPHGSRVGKRKEECMRKERVERRENERKERRGSVERRLGGGREEGRRQGRESRRRRC